MVLCPLAAFRIVWRGLVGLLAGSEMRLPIIILSSSAFVPRLAVSLSFWVPLHKLILRRIYRNLEAIAQFLLTLSNLVVGIVWNLLIVLLVILYFCLLLMLLVLGVHAVNVCRRLNVVRHDIHFAFDVVGGVEGHDLSQSWIALLVWHLQELVGLLLDLYASNLKILRGAGILRPML